MAPPTVRDSITQITTLGAALIARQTLGDLAFVPTHFAIGDDGWNPGVPQWPLPVDPDDSALVHEVWRSPIERFDAPTDSTLAIVCRIPSGAGVRCAMGELGIFVTLTAVNNPMPLISGGPALSIGDVIMFSLTHTALRCITPDQTDLHRIVVSL